MCGISGILSESLDVRYKNNTVESMVRLQSHRGPDEDGFYSDENVSLGHNRLSIIDIAGGKQPIYNEDKTLVIIYNGEIYNYVKIRDELLSKRHKFTTNTDTEVIIHAFEEWGEGCFSRFNGMFAFALWDIKNKNLYLGRDRLGIKPLYVLQLKDALFFASEIKAFSCIDNYDLVIDNYGLIQYLCFQNYFGSATIYNDIKRVEAGCVYRYSANLTRQQIHYDNEIHSIDYNKSFDEWVDKFGSTFHDAVERHMIADVRVGSYLSGGFDSTLVSCVAQGKKYPERLLTFNGYFAEGKGYDESFFAGKVVEKIKSEHYSVIITSSDFKNEIDRIVYHLDEPMMGPGAFSQFIVAREISKHVKVVLTGHGGDEFFAGYPSYKAALLRDNIFLYAKEIFTGGKLQDWVRLAYFIIYPLLQPLLKYGLPILFSPGEIRKLLIPDLFPYDGNEFLHDRIATISSTALKPYERLQSNYIKGYLQGLLVVEDKISMAHSLESRTPLCDNEILQLALQIPPKFKLYQGNLKAVIKGFGKSRLPCELYNQPKRGFPTPIHLWFKNELKDWMEERLFDEKCQAFNNRYLEYIWKKFISIRLDSLYAYNYGCKLFSILCLKILIGSMFNYKPIRLK